MLRNVIAVALATSALGLVSPPASASPGDATAWCTRRGVVQIVGFVAAHTPGEAVTIRCYVTVGGEEVFSTPIGSGVQFAWTAGPGVGTGVLCAEWVAGGFAGARCGEL